jgi:hypothetical protein
MIITVNITMYRKYNIVYLSSLAPFLAYSKLSLWLLKYISLCSARSFLAIRISAIVSLISPSNCSLVWIVPFLVAKP